MDIEKVWYIFKYDHHVGPYDFDELQMLVEYDDVDRSTLIWKEGLKGWISVENSGIFTFPKELPPLPDDALLSSSVESSSQSQYQSEIIEEIAEVYDTVESEFDIPNIPDISEIPSDEIKIIPKRDKPKRSKAPFVKSSSIPVDYQKVKFALGIITILILIFSVVVVKNSFTSKKRPRKISSENYNRLIEVAESSKDTKLDVGLTVDGKSMWVATNNSADKNLFISFVSIPGKIVGNKHIDFSLKTRFSGNYSRVYKYIFSQGKNIVPGHYIISVKGRDMGARPKIMSVLKSFKFLNFISYVQEYSPEFSYTGNVHLFKNSSAKSDKLITKYVDKMFNKKVIPFIGLMESYRTLNSLLMMFADSFNRVVENHFTYESVSDLKSLYFNSIAPILQGIILDGHKKYNKMLNTNIKVKNILMIDATKHEQLYLFGKEIGALASVILTQSNSNKRMNDDSLTIFLNKISELRERGTIRISKLEKSLKIAKEKFFHN